MVIQEPIGIFEGNFQMECLPAWHRVHDIFEEINHLHCRSPQFILCILPGQNSNLYGCLIVDSTISATPNSDFYICAHAGRTGTTRPTYYRIIVDQIGIPKSSLQELVHSLCYGCQCSTSGISVVAPVYYANKVAIKMEKLLKKVDGPLEPMLDILLKQHFSISWNFVWVEVFEYFCGYIRVHNPYTEFAYI
ncbi:hypothetical protein GIB67_001400 [Kingdonia uniflora]|uniref:Piwi domain-containing protein n=1 Tax=Kingdonia uniflora TaxID=39325 RepID=A0A7J7N7N8_9MAGN|nr:hypothetical protein GIB67_001400 [Kingdonia uniflora]